MEAVYEEVRAFKVTITMTEKESLALEFILSKIWNRATPSEADRDFAKKLDKILEVARTETL